MKQKTIQQRGGTKPKVCFELKVMKQEKILQDGSKKKKRKMDISNTRDGKRETTTDTAEIFKAKQK